MRPVRPEAARVRRFFLLLAEAMRLEGLFPLSGLNHGQQAAEASVLLPDTFPGVGILRAHHRGAAEDIDGAKTEEFTDLGLTGSQAIDIANALEAMGYGLPWVRTFDPKSLILTPTGRVTGAKSITTPVIDMGIAKLRTLALTATIDDVSGVAPSLAVEIDGSADGTTWAQIGALGPFTAPVVETDSFATDRYVRARWSSAGADTSLLFSLTGHAR